MPWTAIQLDGLPSSCQRARAHDFPNQPTHIGHGPYAFPSILVPPGESWRLRRRERDAPDKARADGPSCRHWDSIPRGGTTFLIGWLSSSKWEPISAV
jgi:hypothetical protein